MRDQYAVTLQRFTDSFAIKVSVAGVDDYADYRSVSSLFEELGALADLRVDSVSGDRLTYRVLGVSSAEEVARWIPGALRPAYRNYIESRSAESVLGCEAMKNTVLDAKWLPWVLLAVVVIFIWQLHAILTPFVIGALIAYMGDPVVDRLEARGHSRSSGVAIVFLALLAFLTVVLSVVLPLSVKQLAEIVQSVPDAYQWLSETAIPWVQARLSLSPVALPSIDWESGIVNHWQSLGQATGSVLKQITTSGLSLVGTILNIARFQWSRSI